MIIVSFDNLFSGQHAGTGEKNYPAQNPHGKSAGFVKVLKNSNNVSFFQILLMAETAVRSPRVFY